VARGGRATGPPVTPSSVTGNEIATVLLSGALVVIGVLQLVRAAVATAGPVAWVVGAAFVVAGVGRLWLWWRQRTG
jgi:hypothetical protein